MSLAGSHPFEPHRDPPPRSCPHCSCDLHGDRLCEVCGAADFHGAGLWVCFACGERNRSPDERCRGCGKNHVIACPACGYEGYHRDLRCESCGAARALYPTIRKMLLEAARPHPAPVARNRAITVSVVLALVALSAAVSLGLAGKRSEAAVAASAGGAGALSTALLGRRRSGERTGLN
ncbi:hypothetical protein [Vulgatibacter sp.]|uniref:hypothetical protein n=1 Tax=Vulgatibacter sp. TaxID=1971226 RepID=UPI00356AE707